MKTKKLSSYNEKFELFCFFLNDINNYFEKRSVLEKIPKSFKILDEIKEGTSIYKLIRQNNIDEINRKELERRDIIDKKRKGIKPKELTPEEKENEILNAFKKSINCKRYINPSSFGQRNFNVIDTFFSSKNEVLELKNMIIKKIIDLLSECVDNVKDEKKEVNQKENQIILKKKKSSSEEKENKKIIQIYQNLNLFNQKRNNNILSFELNDKMSDKFFNQLNQNSNIIKNKKKINNKNINKFNKTRNIRLIKNNTFNSQIDSERNKINLIASIEKRILSSNPSLKNNIRKIPLNLSSSNKKKSLNNSINPSFKNSLIRNALSESNFDFNLDYIKKLWRNESNERLKSDKKFSTKFSVDGKNYDYSNLMSLRHIKLKTKIAKYPAFSLTKNVIIFKKDSQFPSLLFPKSKKKNFNIYLLRNIHLKKKIKK